MKSNFYVKRPKGKTFQDIARMAEIAQPHEYVRPKVISNAIHLLFTGRTFPLFPATLQK